MRIRQRPLFFFALFLVVLFFLPRQAHARRRSYNLHRGPGMKFGIVGRIRAGEKVEVVGEEAGWVKIRRRNGKEGWISQRLFQGVWKARGKKRKASASIKIDLEFQNIPKACVGIFEKPLKDLQERLAPVGDNDLELVVSAVPRLKSYYLFLTIDFNPAFYRRAMKRFAQPEVLDLLPFNPCIWALHAYKRTLIRAYKKGADSSCTFVKRLAICLVLRRLSGEEVILKTVEDGVYIYFSPVLIYKQVDGQSFRIMAVEPKKVGLLSAFTLPSPYEEGGEEAERAAEVYHFFRKRQ